MLTPTSVPRLGIVGNHRIQYGGHIKSSLSVQAIRRPPITRVVMHITAILVNPSPAGLT
jgi:hypothetical protein